MPYPPRSATPQAVGAALKRAGFNRVAPFYGAGRMNDTTAGYKVTKSRTAPNAVEVLWFPSSLATEPTQEWCTAMLMQYSGALEAAGFRCDLTQITEKLFVYARRNP